MIHYIKYTNYCKHFFQVSVDCIALSLQTFVRETLIPVISATYGGKGNSHPFLSETNATAFPEYPEDSVPHACAAYM